MNSVPVVSNGIKDVDFILSDEEVHLESTNLTIDVGQNSYGFYFRFRRDELVSDWGGLFDSPKEAKSAAVAMIIGAILA